MNLPMPLRLAVLCVAVGGSVSPRVFANGIATGDVVVYQTRNDIIGNANAGPLSILDINPNTPALAQSFPISSQSSPLYSTARDPIETLALSEGNSQISFAGWTSDNAASGFLGTQPGIARGVGVISSTGNYAQPSTYNPATLSGPDQPHAAYSPDGVNWYFGDTSGIYYNSGTTPLKSSPSVTTDNTLAIKGFAGTTYALHTVAGSDEGLGVMATVLSTISPPAPSSGITSITFARSSSA